MLSVLRQPRYVALTALMTLVAIVCVGLGVWQVDRFLAKHDANGQLRRNDHLPVAAVAQVLHVVPDPVTSDAVEFRPIAASGTYDAAHQVLVRRQQVDDVNGFEVLTPLHTEDGVLLVVRGFVTDATKSYPPPTGTVTIVGRARPPQRSDDKAAALGGGQVDTVNPVQQQGRLGGAVFNGFAELRAGQPGTEGLTALPEPDLSNPAGGAVEPQHLAYVLQWFLFALLALGVPVILARAELRQAAEPADGAERTPDQARQAMLADRYGRPVSRRSAP